MTGGGNLQIECIMWTLYLFCKLLGVFYIILSLLLTILFSDCTVSLHYMVARAAFSLMRFYFINCNFANIFQKHSIVLYEKRSWLDISYYRFSLNVCVRVLMIQDLKGIHILEPGLQTSKNCLRPLADFILNCITTLFCAFF